MLSTNNIASVLGKLGSHILQMCVCAHEHSYVALGIMHGSCQRPVFLYLYISDSTYNASAIRDKIGNRISIL